MTPRIANGVRCVLGENPLWDADAQAWYWTDITRGCVYRQAYGSARVDTVHEGGVVGGFTLQVDGSLLLFMADGRIARLADGVLVSVVDAIEEERGTRFNDVIADPRGRVLCGTLPTASRLGRLYRLDLDGGLTVVLDGIQCSNGLAFSRDGAHLYYTDSYAHVIYRIAYQEATGELGPPAVFLTVPEAEGLPDGLVRDADDCLWSARWGGYGVVRHAPDGRVRSRLAVPARHVTSVAFGGPHLTEMLITTAADLDAAPADAAGAVFIVDTGLRGVLEHRSRILDTFG